jgi:septal ring factor EnvC (AmiA/AmiB activator)
MRSAYWPLAFVALVSVALLGFTPPGQEEQYISQWESDIEQLEVKIEKFPGDKKSMIDAINSGKLTGEDVWTKVQDLEAANSKNQIRLAELKFMVSKLTSKGVPWHYAAVMGICLLVAIVSSIDARKARKRLAEVEQSGMAPEPPASEG